MTLKVSKFVVPGQPIVPILSNDSSLESKIHYKAGKNCRLQVIKHNETDIPCIVSSILGKVEIQKQERIETKQEDQDQNQNQNQDQTPEEVKDYDVYNVNVIHKNEPNFPKHIENNIVPAPTKFSISTPSEHDLVLAKVSKISNTRVHVEILNIESLTPIKTTTTIQSLLLTNIIPAESGETFRGIIRSQDIRSTNRDSVQTWKCFQPGDIIRAEVISLGDGVNYYLSTAKNELGVLLAKSDTGELLHAIDWEKMIGLQTGIIESRKCANPF